MCRLLVLWFLLSLSARALPFEVEQALRQRGPVEILSLSPQAPPPRPDPTSGGFLILGRAQLGPKEGALVCAAVLKGLQEGEQDHTQTCCFDPRHALRSGELDVVICYSCHRWNAYRRGAVVGTGRVTDRGSQECERAVIEHGLDWQGWAELDNRFFHATGFSIAPPHDLTVGHRAKHELLRLDVSLGTVIFHIPRKGGGWFTSGESISFESPIPLPELHESMRRRFPGTVGELDLAANQLEVFVPEEDLLLEITGLVSSNHPERLSFYPSRDATAARNYLKEARAELEKRSRLQESSPGLWTGVSHGRFLAVTFLERDGSYLAGRAEFTADEASGRQRLDQLLSSIRYRAPIRQP